MTVKQCVHFHPLIVSSWHLEAIGKEVRETAEFLNLRSCWRGRNRFTNLLLTFEMLARRADVAGKAPLPRLDSLRAYCESGVPLGNPSLEEAVRATDDAELRRTLEWSLAVNEDIAHRMRPIPPFRWAVEALRRMQGHSDTLVVSQTPFEALSREWRQHGIDHLVAAIAGQEAGSKTTQLLEAAAGRYKPGRMLMIGDAPGDRAAAREAGALFYPILPGREEESWRLFCERDYPRFLAGELDAATLDALQAEFDALLPDTPPWEETRPTTPDDAG
jgi:phosphoglycolate phosphatase-like HAD superfamily hydrolase